jgi:hypothetical protein
MEPLAESNPSITPVERSVQVAAGEPTIVEVSLEPLPSGGSIRGFVRTQSGQYRAVESVGLKAFRRRLDRFLAEVEWTDEAGALVGRFAFEDVPTGEYELFPIGSSHFGWRASSERVSPPASDVELLCMDGAGGFWLDVEAFDAMTGLPVRQLALYIDKRDGSRPHSYSAGGSQGYRLDLGRFPRDITFEWGAVCDGYVAVGGDVSSFESVGTKEGEPLLRTRIEFQPGWGGRVLVYTDNERIGGALVLCDDVEVGRTDERGELELALPDRPRRFEVRHPGFVMSHPSTGEVPDDAAVLPIYMKLRE